MLIIIDITVCRFEDSKKSRNNSVNFDSLNGICDWPPLLTFRISRIHLPKTSIDLLMLQASVTVWLLVSDGETRSEPARSTIDNLAHLIWERSLVLFPVAGLRGIVTCLIIKMQCERELL